MTEGSPLRYTDRILTSAGIATLDWFRGFLASPKLAMLTTGRAIRPGQTVTPTTDNLTRVRHRTNVRI